MNFSRGYKVNDRSNAFWDRQAQNYDAQVGKYAKAYADTIAHTKNYLKASDRVFDFGCGTGITTIEVARHVGWVLAMDPAQKMLEVAKGKAEKAGIHNVEFVAGCIFDDRLTTGSFDAVTAFNVLHLLKDQEEIVRRIYALLKPGGLFFSATDCLGELNPVVLSVWKLASKIGIIPRVRAFTKTDIEELVSTGGFSILEVASLYDSPSNYFIAARKG